MTLPQFERTWTRDKSDLPEGEWMREVDKAQWRDAETGLACLVVRNHVGCWCGYVGVTSEHPWWQCSYDDCDVDVHGGLTYAGWGGGGPEESRVIRYAPLEDDPVEVVKERLGISSLWWFGFDCAHSGDLCPRMTRVYQQTGVYRTFAYVVDEVTILAKQVKNNAKMST